MNKKFRSFLFVMILLFVSSLMASCQQGQKKQETPEKSGLSETTRHAYDESKALSDTQEAQPIVGKVIETMNSGGYTYIFIEQNGKKIWVAVPEMKVSIGETIKLKAGAVMYNFRSNTLNRTFDKIIFSGGALEEHMASAATSSGINPHKGLDSDSMISPHGRIITEPIKSLHIEKASGPNAYTIAELYEKAGSLSQKQVVVRGKVVKVLPRIMGKTWVHIQDGSGDPQKGTHDLVVTTQDLPSVEDVVIVTGTLYKDKDFGAGYRYKVIIEEAKIKEQ